MLKVYRNDVVEWVIAASPEDANVVLRESGYAGYVDDDPHEWKECDPSREWTCQEGPADAPLTLTFGEWIERNGRGYLGTTEY